MGVPGFFRWLRRRYPSIIGVEEKVEFDNMYMDMNGILHLCTHPEDKPAPKNEEEMMVAIFKHIDQIVNCVHRCHPFPTAAALRMPRTGPGTGPRRRSARRISIREVRVSRQQHYGGHGPGHAVAAVGVSASGPGASYQQRRYEWLERRDNWAQQHQARPGRSQMSEAQ